MRFGVTLLLILAMLMTSPVFGAPVAPLGQFKYMQPGDVATASDWNTYIVGAYSYINDEIAAQLNKLTTKGDMFGYGGVSGLERLAVGTNTYNLKADSTATPGVSWAADVKQQPMTTKGDLITCAGSTAATRQAIGADDYALTADSTAANGMAWKDQDSTLALPKGSILCIRGSDSVPTGWGVCDGTTQSGTVTPNLIGLFVIGGRPGGSSATPAATGYGARQADNAYGALTHTHTMLVSGTTDTANTGSALTGSGYDASTKSHSHTYSFTATLNSANFEPSDYALIYICKLE